MDALTAADIRKLADELSAELPPALQAVMYGRIVATVRNPSCLIHGGALIAGVAVTVSGERSGEGPGMIPKHVVTNGPVVIGANAPGTF